MAATLVSPLPKLRFVDSNGNALSGGKLFTYSGGTTSKLSTFTDSTGATPNANPIVLNTRGECDCWLTPGLAYKFTLSPSTDSDPPTNAIWTVDNVTAPISASVTIAMSGAAINEASTTIASAGTVNIGAAAANYIFISGTTTITAFDTVQSGTERTLEFQGALTLTYNVTSLILPTKASIVTAAGDTAIFRSEGNGNWRCISYLRASGDAVIDGQATLASAGTVAIGGASASYLAISGTTTITAFDTVPAGICRTLEFQGALTLTHNGTSLILAGGQSILTIAGDVITFRSEGSGNWREVSSNRKKQPTRTVKGTPGDSGNYTPPAGCTRINVRMVGGGAGGDGSGAGSTGGSNGQSSTFSTMTASGGTGAGGAGGSGSGGDINLTGGAGQGSIPAAANIGTTSGAAPVFGVASSGAAGTAGNGAPARSGSGGSGGSGSNSVAAAASGSGAGYCEKQFISPVGPLAYAVANAAAGGSGGSGGFGGGSGGSGLIVIDEFYN